MARHIIVALICSWIGFQSVAGAADKPADVAGPWHWTQTRPDGEQVEILLTLKQDGEKLTGTFHGKGPDSDISGGKIEANQIQFSVEREIEGHKVTLNYKGVVSGDTIKGETKTKVVFREKSAEWEAKRGK